MIKLDLQKFADRWQYANMAYKGIHVVSLDISLYSEVSFTGGTIFDGYSIKPTFEEGYELDKITVLTRNAEFIKKSGDYYIYAQKKPEFARFLVTAKSVDATEPDVPQKRYRVTEPCTIMINGSVRKLTPNIKVFKSKTGAILDAQVINAGVLLPMNDAVKSLIDQGVIEEI